MKIEIGIHRYVRFNPIGFPERMQSIIEKHTSIEKLAEITFVTEEEIKGFLTGTLEPSERNLWRLAEVGGVSREWLAVGSDFPSRVRHIIDKYGSIKRLGKYYLLREFGKATGMSKQTLENYLSGKTDPSLKNLIAMADVGNVSIEWLATGDDQSQCLLSYQEIMKDIIERTETYLQEFNIVLPPKKKAKLITLLHKEYAENRLADEGFLEKMKNYIGLAE